MFTVCVTTGHTTTAAMWLNKSMDRESDTCPSEICFAAGNGILFEPNFPHGLLNLLMQNSQRPPVQPHNAWCQSVVI
jgi:hypothetical protein